MKFYDNYFFSIYQLHNHEEFLVENLQILLDENGFQDHMYKIEIDIQDHIYKKRKSNRFNLFSTQKLFIYTDDQFYHLQQHIV